MCVCVCKERECVCVCVSARMRSGGGGGLCGCGWVGGGVNEEVVWGEGGGPLFSRHVQAITNTISPSITLQHNVS